MSFQRSRTSIFSAFLFASLLLPPRLALAQDAAAEPWDAAFTATPEELLAAAAALPTEEGADVQVLLRERKVRFEDDGRQSSEYRIVYRVLTPVGVESWAGTGAGWRPWQQERPELRSRVVTPDGGEHWLDPATVAEEPVGGGSGVVLSDRLTVRAPLPAVTVGALVEEQITTRDTRPLFARGTVDAFGFARWVGVHRTRLVIDAPRSLPLRYRTQLLDDLEPRRVETGDRVVLTFEAGPREGIESIEELTPGHVPVWPQVTFSTGESWAAVAGHYRELVEEQLVDVDLGRVARKALDGARGREEKIARLLEWLHREIRYTGIEFGEAAFVPHAPAETLTRGYGDCKDKSTLLVALLRAAGIEAEIALLSTGPGRDLDPELPGIGSFDHAVVYVPGPPETWIDATAEFARAGELPAGDQGRLALIASPEATGLVTTPVSGPGDNLVVETREIYLAADLGGARIVETTRYHGSFEQDYRGFLHGSDPGDVEEQMAGYMESMFLTEELVAWEHSDPRDLSAPLELRLEGTQAQAAMTDLTQALVLVNSSQLLNNLPDLVLQEDEEDEDAESGGDADITAGKRQADLELPVPYVAEQRYRIVPPDGYRPVSLPEPEERRLGPSTLSREVSEEDDGTVAMTLRFDTGKRLLTPGEMEALREAAQELFEEEALEVLFEQVGEAHLVAGDVRAALAEIDRLIAAAPERALPRSRRARALLEAGLGAAARREAEAAVELEPELYLAHQTLGLVHLRDLVGREFYKGMDFERAAAAFRKAAELEESDEADRVNLAVLFEHDEEGLQYGRGARLDEAIAEHLALCDDPETSTCYEHNLLTDFARAGRFEEMAQRTGRPGRAVDSFRLVALAATQGIAAAIREARRIDGSGRQQALTAAGQLLLQLRLYQESAEIFAASAKGAADATQVLGMANLLRKVRPLEEIEPAMEEPTSIVWRALRAVTDEDYDGFLALMTERMKENLDPDSEMLRQLEELPGLRRLMVRQVGLSFKTLLDIGLAAIEFSVDGDDETGYRIRSRTSVGGTQRKDVYFVSRENGEYLLTASEKLPDLGREALWRLEADQLTAARQWLDWASELTSAPGADDPYAGQPFFRFWSKGQEGDAAAVRAAAASLMTGGTRAEEAAAILEEGREEVPESERPRFDLALALAYDQLDRDEELASLARRWLTEHPDSGAAFRYLRRALGGLGRWDDLARAADERLDALADDPAALRALAQVARERGDFERRRRLFRRLVELGKANANDYNELAWMDVVAGTVTEKTLEDAQQAASHDKDRAILHTLATVYADLGMGTEAREVLLQAMTLGNDDEPRSEDWYVWGRIAESYGLLDSAAEAYQKVMPPEEDPDDPSSTYRIAQRRLAALTRS